MERLSTQKFREVGQVYVYLQGEGFLFSSKPNQVLTGTWSYGRFGSAIAPLGDIDYDGFNGENCDGQKITLHLIFSKSIYASHTDTCPLYGLLQMIMGFK